MEFEDKKHKYNNYFFVIDLAPKHEMFQHMNSAFTMLPAGDFAMYTSKRYYLYEEALAELRGTLTQTLKHCMDQSLKKCKILWERNDFSDEEREEHRDTLKTMQWLDTELLRFYGIMIDEEFTGTEWFLRARLMYKDEGIFIHDIPKTLQ